jgi:hypothetical protein
MSHKTVTMTLPPSVVRARSPDPALDNHLTHLRHMGRNLHGKESAQVSGLAATAVTFAQLSIPGAVRPAEPRGIQRSTA